MSSPSPLHHSFIYIQHTASEIKSLIGDITPKAVTLPTPPSTDGQAPSPALMEGDNSTQGVSTSSWNHAGTWEERDMTQFCRDRLQALCLEAKASLEPGTVGGADTATSSLAAALDAMKSSLGGGVGKSEAGTGDAMSQLTALSASMSRASACVASIENVEGEAQIVMARGKKRHIYDFSMEVKFEVTVEDMLADKDKPKKFKGSLHVPEVSPDSSQETPYTTKWKKLHILPSGRNSCLPTCRSV